MKSVANFYTLFWIVYFPTCIVFYNSSFQYMDEFLCLLMAIYAFMNQHKLYGTKAEKNEIKTCFWVMAFYTLYSLFIQVTSIKGVFLDLLQQIRPYGVFYITLLMAPRFTRIQKRLIVFSLLLGMIAYFLMGRNAHEISGTIEDGGLPMVALTCGMTYYLFTKPTKMNMYIAIVIMLVGLLSGKSKYIGQCICFIAIVLFVKKRLDFKSPKVYLSVVTLVAIVIFFTWTKFNSYYVEGFEEEEVAEMAARPATYTTGLKILGDYFPFGSGFGSFGVAAAAKEYSPLYYKYDLYNIWGLTPENPMFLADCFYPTLAEFGIVGIFLFLVFWKRRFKDINEIKSLRYYQMALMAIFALAIDSTANTAYLSGVGMGLFMTLAICLRSDRIRYLNIRQ